MTSATNAPVRRARPKTEVPEGIVDLGNVPLSRLGALMRVAPSICFGAGLLAVDVPRRRALRALASARRNLRRSGRTDKGRATVNASWFFGSLMLMDAF